MIYQACQCTSYQIRKLAVCACAGNAGNVFSATDFKRNCGLEIPACITARASHTCRAACRDRQLAVRGKRSQHSRRMRNPQFYVSRKRPMGWLPRFSPTTHVWDQSPATRTTQVSFKDIHRITPSENYVWNQIREVNHRHTEACTNRCNCADDNFKWILLKKRQQLYFDSNSTKFVPEGSIYMGTMG